MFRKYQIRPSGLLTGVADHIEEGSGVRAMQHEVPLHQNILTRHAQGHSSGSLLTPIIDIRAQEHENVVAIFSGGLQVVDSFPHHHKWLLFQNLQVHAPALHRGIASGQYQHLPPR